MKSIPIGIILATAILFAPAAAGQDSMALKDGRFVFGKTMTRTPKGVRVAYDNGEVFVPNDLIKTVTVSHLEGVEDDLTPEDKKRMEEGLVRYDGKWMKKAKAEKAIEKAKERRLARIAEAKKHRIWRNRHKMVTKNFEFQYTIDPDVMKEFADLMETYYKRFTKEWKIRKPKGHKRVVVCFYHDEDTYYQVSGAPGGAIGYFKFVHPIELNFYYNRLDKEQTEDVMFHEANHYLTWLIDPKFRYPAWVNESLAEYYGASQWDREKKKMSMGHLQEGRLTVVQDEIKNDRLLGLEEMIRIERFNATHYAWGWSFVHFLLEHPKYKKKFKKYYVDLARNRSIKRVPSSFGMRQVEPDEQIKHLKKYLGVKSLTELEKQWHDYVKGLKSTGPRGYELAGRIALSRGMPIKAQRYYRTAIEAGSTNPLTFYNYSRALYQKRKYDEAAEQMARALEMDPLNGDFYFQKAQIMERQKGDKDEIKRLKRLALEVDPDNYGLLLRIDLDEVMREDDKN